MIQLQNIYKSFGSQELLLDAFLQIGRGERIGLSGRNGSGKSTLLRMIIGQENLDGGDISIPRNYSLGYLEQHLSFSHPTILAEACSALQLNEDGWLEEHKAQAMLFGLGFDQDDLERSPQELSGGFQIRLNLCKVMLAEPDMLLLDEPTNYLDIVSIRWLERFLLNWPGELILITHDRRFMNAVCTHTALIHRQKIRKMPGSVEKLLQTIADEEELQMRTLANEARKHEQAMRFIERFRAQATKAAAVQSRIKALERQAPIEKLSKIKDLDFNFAWRDFPGKRMLAVQDLSFRWSEDSPWLVQNFGLEVFPGDRIAVIGPNGKGKTTLLNLIAQEIEPVEGKISFNPHTELGYFGQTNIQRLDESKSVEAEIESACADSARGRARTLAGLMMFEGDAALKPVSVLSGGERSRVLLAKILAQEHNLLLLDEPTNHLDMESIDSLIDAVDEFPGAVLLVSHDEGILHSLANRLVVFDGGKSFVFEGSYQEFLQRVGWSGERSVSGEKEANQSRNQGKSSRRERAEYVALRSQKLRPVEKAVQKCEKLLESLEQSLADAEAQMVEAANAGIGEKIAELAQNSGKLQKEIDEQYALWEKLQVELENLHQQYPLE
ncbi:MAG: ABC-F family ATP-binding cassette domain-containing protein [Fibrobacter sp.]|nr:ABC-F family ATP-binding cassette domain-containing protein [Fibrobacter sp.]